MTPHARKYIEDNRSDEADEYMGDLTPAIALRCEIATRVVERLIGFYGTNEKPETLAAYAVNQADWLLEVLART